MIDPHTLFEKVMEATADIPAIKKRHFVASDEEFTKFLEDHKSTDNQMLVSVLPSYSGFGENEDENGSMTFMQFFVLEKVDYKSFKTNEEYIDVFSKTLETARQFLINMYSFGMHCTGDLVQPEYNIRPVSRKAGCNGYEIQIDAKAYNDLIS